MLSVKVSGALTVRCCAAGCDCREMGVAGVVVGGCVGALGW